MYAPRFDRLTRALIGASSRRRLLRGIAITLGLAAVGFPGAAEARKKRENKKRKNKKLKRNAFGCVDVGQACRGTSANCCSGICQGKKPKNGKKDTSKCVAHDTGGCQANEGNCGQAAVVCTTSAGGAGVCKTTTGNAGYCQTDNFASCQPCRQDVDCLDDLGANAACIVCTSCADGTACVNFEA